MLNRIFLSSNERRLRTLWRFVGFIFFYLFLNIFFGGVLFIFTKGNLKQEWVFYLLVIATFLGTCLAVYYARKLLDRRSFVSLGLIWNRQAGQDLVFGFLVTGLIIGFIFLVERIAGWLDFAGFVSDSTSATRAVQGTVLMFIMFILVGVNEELLYRGYVLQNLADGTNLFWGFLLSSAAFSLNHYANPNFSLEAFVGLLVSGFFLAYPYLRTRQLWLSFGLHIGWNFFEGTIFGFQVSGFTNMPRLIMQTVHGPALFTGGEFGPEAGLVLVPPLFLGACLIYLYTRRRNTKELKAAYNLVHPPEATIH